MAKKTETETKTMEKLIKKAFDETEGAEKKDLSEKVVLKNISTEDYKKAADSITKHSLHSESVDGDLIIRGSKSEIEKVKSELK